MIITELDSRLQHKKLGYTHNNTKNNKTNSITVNRHNKCTHCEVQVVIHTF